MTSTQEKFADYERLARFLRTLSLRLRLLANPFSALPQRKAVLAVEPGETTILRGSPLAIRASIWGQA